MGKMSLLLNGEQKKAFFEFYAREVLNNFQPEIFDNLKKLDKPDLQDFNKNIGVEVTLSCLYSEMYAVDLHDKIIETSKKIEKEKYIKRLKKIKCEPLEYNGEIVGVGFPAYKVTSSPLIITAKKKIEKLNKTNEEAIDEYRSFLHYMLFIFDSISSDKYSYLYELMNATINYQFDCVRKFEVIYVYNDLSFYACDLKENRIIKYLVTDEQRKHFKKCALEMVYAQ